MRILFISMLISMLAAGCAARPPVPIVNKIDASISPQQEQDLRELINQYPYDVHEITIDTVMHPSDTRVAVVDFEPERVDAYTWLLRSDWIYRDDWPSAFNKLFGRKESKRCGDWYAGGSVIEIKRHRYVLNCATLFLSVDEDVSYGETLEILRALEAGNVKRKEPDKPVKPFTYAPYTPGFPDDFDVAKVSSVRKAGRHGEQLYEVRTRERKHRGRVFHVRWQDDELVLEKSFFWVS